MRNWITAAAILVVAAPAGAILRHPTGVNVNSQGATTVFITFGQLDGQVPVEAFWCGELQPAAPDIGFKCDPSTIFGRLPLRHELGRSSGQSAFTDIMTIPPAVARRAYEAAAAGEPSAFFYVRRFVSTRGGPDEYVFVTCRLTGGGARTPLSLLDVRMAFETENTVLSIRPGEEPPPLFADLSYTGSGRLKGRWEIVLPGDEPPATEDLLTEASLPVELRPLQRRFTEVGRFNVFLPPVGRFRLPGPDPDRLPRDSEGLYQVLLRIEASADKEGDSSLAAVGEGTGVVRAGAVAGFPIPPLRYFVGSASTPRLAVAAGTLALLLPAADAVVPYGAPMVLSWAETPHAAFFRAEVLDAEGAVAAAALLNPGVGSYRLPPFVAERAAAGPLRWRVVALDPDGEQITATPWREFSIAAPAPGADSTGESS
jgi:hypothetical protein